MGTQIGQSSDVMNVIARKGGDLVTPNLEKDDYVKRKTTQKMRGRKNKYYK